MRDKKRHVQAWLVWPCVRSFTEVPPLLLRFWNAELHRKAITSSRRVLYSAGPSEVQPSSWERHDHGRDHALDVAAASACALGLGPGIHRVRSPDKHGRVGTSWVWMP